MNPSEELKMLCVYVLAVAKATLPSQLKYELIFCAEVSAEINRQVSLGTLYGYVDPDTDFRDDVFAYAAAIEKLLADLEKIEWTEKVRQWKFLASLI